MRTISVIIPTINRHHDLKVTLDSLLSQTILPNEVIIIDQSKEINLAEKEIINLINKKTNSLSAKIKYIFAPSIKSLTCAKNKGIDEAEGDIVLFLDDDVILEKDFINAILQVYDKYPDAFGVAGVMVNFKRSNGQKIFSNIFYLGSFRDTRLNIYSNLEKYMSRQVVRSNKLGGGISSFKKVIFKDYRFDENYLGYSPGEDTDFSYRVSLQYKLFIAPHARLFHRWSHFLGTKDEIIKRTEYLIGGWWYFYKKNISKSIFNIICFLWLNLGFFLSALISLLLNGNKAKFLGSVFAYNKIIFKKGKFGFLKTVNN